MTKKDDLELISSLRGKSDTEHVKQLQVLYTSSNPKVSIAALEMLASFGDKNLLNFYLEILNNHKENQTKRKEAMSAIGRLRDEKIALEVIAQYLEDPNPEIILQAIRGMLVFKKNPNIVELLLSHRHHKNELIRYIIAKEFELDIPDMETKQEHILVPKEFSNVIVLGDSLSLAKQIPDASIHLTFTSPPYYNARDYSIYQSYEEYLDFLEELFKEIFRVTKDGRFLIVNTSPIIIPRIGRKYASKRYPIPYDLHARLVKLGWEFIDDIIWLKPEASVKNRIGGFLQQRKPLMYKPNAITENIMVYRKKSNKLIDWNLEAYPDETIRDSLVGDGYESTNVWRIDPVFNKSHTAVFPEGLCDRVISYYSLKGDLVFDPFAGSGTVGRSALKLDRKVLLSEIDSEYYKIIEGNLVEYRDELNWESLN